MSDPMIPYAPLQVLKPLADDIWIVDGPVIRMRYGPVRLPFTTRMTVIRLPGGALWIHSPIALTDDLRTAITALGPVTYLIAPNRLHWAYLAEWQARFPDAETHAAPKVALSQDKGGFRIDAELGDAPPAAWADTIDQVLVPGGFMDEAVFFHRPSGSVILTDLIENFEAGRIPGAVLRWAMRLGGVMHPHGSTPRDLRLTFLPKRRAMREAARRILAWDAARVILAHGRVIDDDAPAALRRGLGWTGAV